jgi:hypothetical protein
VDVIRAALLSALAAWVSVVALSSCGTSEPTGSSSSTPTPRHTAAETQLLSWVDDAGQGAIELTDLSAEVAPSVRERADRSARKLLRRAQVRERGVELGYVGTGVLSVDTSPPIHERDVVVVTLASPKTDQRPAMSFVFFLSADGRRYVFQFSRAPGTTGELELESGA